MAQLILTGAAQAARAGLGAIVARTVAGAAASFATSSLTNAIFGPRRRSVEGPRLESFSVQASTEGAGVLRVWGRARVAGQLIWAARFRETVSETSQTAGGKGGPSVRTDVREYLYSLSFAVGLCEGPISRIARVWADGKPFDLSTVNARIYHGTEDQTPDVLIEAIEGAAPAFRGLAYIVFDDLPLRDFGNRIPQLAFEVERPLDESDPAALENALSAVTMIPGSGEFVYGTTSVTRQVSEGVVAPENAHASAGETDFIASLDNLTATAPNLSSVSLVVSWFGDDLEARDCSLRPGVETAVKETEPYFWRAGGVDRAGARIISTLNGEPVYGGTPADRSVVEAIRAMNDRGIDVMIHPFILMDAPGFPWRGRIASSADGAPVAANDVDAFFGAAAPSNFQIVGDDVIYSGPEEWSFRRFILHYAWLARAAGGVEAFILASELRGLTTTRSGAGAYPFVDRLVALAADVRAILGADVKLSYGADWSEWFGHQPGGGDVYFHLDPLWADSNIDFIGVDNYTPLADWRDSAAHLDGALADSPYDIDYLMGNIEGGERYDWFYASQSDRDDQIRTQITDGAYDEAWIYRAKDFANWWASPHHNRQGGVRASAPTPWIPQSKPFRFTEIGCPAVDKGANAPNVFVDPKSIESALPPYSSGARDDMAQRRFLEAHHRYWREGDNNPISAVYGGPMINADKFYVYAWDARPFPFFPARDDVWGDAPNWARGHWLTGRLGRAPLDQLIAAIVSEGDVDASAVDTSRVRGAIAGYVIDRPMSPREMIDPLADVFQIDMVETVIGARGALRFQPRHGTPVATFRQEDLAATQTASEIASGVNNAPPFTVTLGQSGDAPSTVRIGFLDEGADYGPAVAAANVAPDIADIRETGLELPAIMNPAEAESRARALLADAHVQRERAQFALPPSQLALEPGDGLYADLGGIERRWRVIEINDGAERRMEAVRLSSAVHEAPQGETVFAPPALAPVFGAPLWEVIDAPLLREEDDASSVLFAAAAVPWPGAVALYRDNAQSPGATISNSPAGVAERAAIMGRLADPLPPIPAECSGLWREETIRLRLVANDGAILVSRSAEDVLAGANILFIKSDNDLWEVMQFRDAHLGEDGLWSLTGLLRGQAGSEAAVTAGAGVDARVVVATPALAPVPLGVDRAGLSLDWRAGPAQELPSATTFTSRPLPYTAMGVRPLSPVHLRAARYEELAGGAVETGWRLSWIRRTRIGGDNWEVETTPLGEAFERYRVEIKANGAVVRSVEGAASSMTYSDVEAAADGVDTNAGQSLTYRVAQLSDLVGLGSWSSEKPLQ